MIWILLILAAILVVCLIARFRSPAPRFPPIHTDPDDPLLLEAMEKAKATLPDFCKLFQEYPEDAFVKLRFDSNTGVVEHLGAHVESIEDDELKVLLITPPVTHKGHLESSYICTFDDLEDWQVTDIEGNIYGGFTQRVLYEIARKQGVELPSEIAQMEQQYVDIQSTI